MRRPFSQVYPCEPGCALSPRTRVMVGPSIRTSSPQLIEHSTQAVACHVSLLVSVSSRSISASGCQFNKRTYSVAATSCKRSAIVAEQPPLLPLEAGQQQRS